MTEVAQYQPTTDLAEQIRFAQMVTVAPERGAQSMLPESYRGNPANVLIAVGLGASMGLSPAESLYRISVIKGKPSAAAELIASNVRKAGHKLRVRVTENPPSATCTIVRADDPDEPTTITRDMAWAQRMGLANEPNYKKQPETMLSYRAITACARLACPEALYGVSYTPDEARDLPAENDTPRASSGDFLPATVVADEIVEEEREDTRPEQPSDEWPNQLTDGTRKRMFALFTKHGITDRDEQIAGIVRIIGRPIQSRSELTEDEAQKVILSVEAHFAQQVQP
jgi:hypothetical protein